MSKAVKTSGAEPLRLDSAWRITENARSGATVHPLHVVSGGARRGLVEGDELRALVAEIVRDELRSDLGRRMTGLIRQLVRSEVAQVFARLGRR